MMGKKCLGRPSWGSITGKESLLPVILSRSWEVVKLLVPEQSTILDGPLVSNDCREIPK
jgi:hypothetical protein